MTPYPFQPSACIQYETSRKLKILAKVNNVPITKMIVQIIDEYYLYTDVDKIKTAIIKLNIKAGDQNV